MENERELVSLYIKQVTIVIKQYTTSGESKHAYPEKMRTLL